MRAVRGIFGVLTLAALAACSDSTGPQDPEDVEFASSLGIDLAQMTRLPSGVYIQTTTAGTGTKTVVSSSQISASYRGWLPSGAQFDEGSFQGFTVSGFIPGFADGVTGMKVGEVRKIVVPSELAYGAQPPAGIPAHSVLVFEVTLTAIAP